MHTLTAISQTLLAAACVAGHFVKLIGSNAVDASLLGIVLPNVVFPLDHPLVSATVQEIECHLAKGGVHRYGWDTYYGGGAWLLLEAWLGW